MRDYIANKRAGEKEARLQQLSGAQHERLTDNCKTAGERNYNRLWFVLYTHQCQYATYMYADTASPVHAINTG